MISRAQRILFLCMLIAVVVMATILIRLRERAQDRFHALEIDVPTVEPASAAPESIALLMPNDTDGSLVEIHRTLPMPQDESARARVLIETLLRTFREPHSTHPLAPLSSQYGGSSTASSAQLEDALAAQDLDEVYLMPIPQAKGSTPVKGQMAVIDFTSAFTAAHPSGIEPETLTLLAVLGTLHDNLPDITQVRFLVDGHVKDTLAGHADLTRTYVASDTATSISGDSAVESTSGAGATTQ
ncbi:GerMN domain-containing protein [Silvibacterium sp.]|uniref:GerMN domain-containing protein n=1 Tax=Silvibacterium sp. TaxID=1964179 RepID=UPI0039E255F7